MEQDAHPLFSLSSLGFGLSTPSTKPLPPPPPCVEVHLSEVSSPHTQVDLTRAHVQVSEPLDSLLESIVINDELTLLKGRVNTGDVFGMSNSDLVPGKYEGGLKLWEGSVDLVNCLYSEVRDGRLSLAGRRVLELGCGHGLPGIYACLQGAAVVHFQDFNAEVLKCLTILNVKSNLTKEQSQSESTSLDMANSEIKVNPSTKVQFFSGDWSEVHHLLFHGGDDKDQGGTRVSAEQDQYTGYDVILMAETVYSLSSLGDLYGLIKKCLNHHNGVVYMAGKKHYFGVGGGTRQFIHMVNDDGVMLGSLLSEVADGSSNVREIWKLSFKSA
ncbi:hypothetical protein Taro_028804 [Colocasia esculenta]|uniref:protein-histidine N-methyltransferase n=1 Tax=Colocasia esculenta TaxID=4460 RepID=A0A843VHD2_COLES|nr:hypothetical protein [Colocasia esculenta]